VRLVYLGTPEAAVPPLQALVEAGHEVLLVVSQPDRRRGRGSALIASPVKQAALELGLTVTDRLDDVFDAVGNGAELGVVVAYGRLIRQPMLDALPFVNLHFSLLPRWRGAAPVERAILAGDTETGVCLMGLEAGLDTGPVYRRETTAIGGDESAHELRSRLVEIGSAMLIDALRDGLAGLGSPVVQTGEVTIASKFEAAEFELDWSRPAIEVHRRVRVGGAWTTAKGKRLKVHRTRISSPSSMSPGAIDGVVVAAGDGTGVELLSVQPEGKGAMEARAWRNGAGLDHGDILGR
jgi:methionyl-tRNA formyltransferase